MTSPRLQGFWLSGHDVTAAAVVAFSVAATILPVEHSETCYTDGPLYVGSEPDGLIIASDLKLESAGVWCALATASAVIWWRPTTTAVAAMVVAWAVMAAGLSSISNVECDDDRTGPGFWVAHIALTVAPWVLIARD